MMWYMVWYGRYDTVRYDTIYDMISTIRYDRYDTWCDIWCDILYMIWYMIRYDMIYDMIHDMTWYMIYIFFRIFSLESNKKVCVRDHYVITGCLHFKVLKPVLAFHESLSVVIICCQQQHHSGQWHWWLRECPLGYYVIV